MNPPRSPPRLDLTYEEDLLVARLDGDYDMEIELFLQAARAELEDIHGYRLILLDGRRVGTITPDARRAMVAWSRGRTAPGAIAMFGATFSGATLARMVLSAVRVLSKRHMNFDFFKSEAEARAWLAERRKHLRELIGG